jgi:hypothetical protein
MAGMSPTRRRSRKTKASEPTFTVADYYRMKLTGKLPPSRPTMEEYLRHATMAHTQA